MSKENILCLRLCCQTFVARQSCYVKICLGGNCCQNMSCGGCVMLRKKRNTFVLCLYVCRAIASCCQFVGSALVFVRQNIFFRAPLYYVRKQIFVGQQLCDVVKKLFRGNCVMLPKNCFGQLCDVAKQMGSNSLCCQTKNCGQNIFVGAVVVFLKIF